MTIVTLRVFCLSVELIQLPGLLDQYRSEIQSLQVHSFQYGGRRRPLGRSNGQMEYEGEGAGW